MARKEGRRRHIFPHWYTDCYTRVHSIRTRGGISQANVVGVSLFMLCLDMISSITQAVEQALSEV